MPDQDKVRIDGRQIWVGSSPIPLLSGEVHYWRLAPQSWKAVLEKAQQMGIEIIATYVCWDFHETKPGQYDFSGQTDPRRNLVGFLELLEEMGFWIIIRPGPYIYSEWLNAGIPDRAARLHRLDPQYLAMARQWLQAVAKVIVPRQCGQGGRIILCQAENELDCWPHIYTEQLGLGNHPGIFQEFLAQRYSDIQDLNRVWESQYTSFPDAHAVLSLPPGRADWMPRYLDFYRFKHWYVARGIEWTVKTLRELGIEVPIYSNTIAVHSNEPWAEMEQIAGLNGVDLYPSRDFHHPDEHRLYLDAARYLSTYSRLPYIAEFEAGAWHGAHVESQIGALSANHYRMAAISALQAGVVGWNWYMLVNRDNWSMSPINEWGLSRSDLFTAFQQITALFRKIHPPSLERQVNLAATIDPLHQAAAHAPGEVLQALYEAGLDYHFFDLSQDRQAITPLLFYTGENWLSEKGQQRLLAYIESGGHLVCIGAAPRFDDSLRPYNLLEFPEAIGSIGDMGAISIHLQGIPASGSFTTRWIEIFTNPPGTAIWAVRESVDPNVSEEMALHCSLPIGAQYTIGFTREIGIGRLTYLGIQPSASLVSNLCAGLGVHPALQTNSPGISAALFKRRDGQYYLLATNNTLEEKAADIKFAPDLFSSPLTFHNLLNGEKIQSADPGRVFLPIKAKDAAAWEIQEKRTLK